MDIEITKTINNKLTSLIGKMASLGDEAELEARMTSFTPYNVFLNVLHRLIFDKEMGGMALNYEVDSTLDITQAKDNTRLVITGLDNIKQYWLTETLDGIDDYHLMEKTTVERVDLDEYNVRISLSKETLEDRTDRAEPPTIPTNEELTFRYKNRYMVYSADGQWRYDLTVVRMGTGPSFRQTATLRSIPIYEIEVEYIGSESGSESPKNSELLDSLIAQIGFLINMIQGSSHIITNSEVEAVVKAYKQLTGTSDFIAANPATIHADSLKSLDDYAITLKADGQRNFLFLHESGVYLLNNNFRVIKMGYETPTALAGTLIEGEYIPESNLYLAYDLLFHAGKDYRKRIFEGEDGRAQTLAAVIRQFGTTNSSITDEILVRMKDYKVGRQWADKVWDTREVQDFEVDGIILTPLKEPYPMKSGVWHLLLKWKPAVLNSIDILINVEKTNGVQMRYPLTVGGSVVQYKVLNMYITGYKKGKAYPKEFSPEGEPLKAKVLLINGEMRATDPATGKQEVITDDSIVEFVYDYSNETFPWKPIRVRNDKTQMYRTGYPVFGNSEKTAMDIWESIKEPITIEMLTGDQEPGAPGAPGAPEFGEHDKPDIMLPYQDFHNNVVKQLLIPKAGPDSQQLLDLGSAQGRDMEKWAAAGYKMAIGIDSDQESITYANNQFKQNPPADLKAHFIWADLKKLIFPDQAAALSNAARSRLEEYMPAKYSFGTVSCFYALQYFMEDERILRTFLQNVSDNLEIGGEFVGACLDGVRVYDALKRKTDIEGLVPGETNKNDDVVLWRITKEYKTKKITTTKPYGLEVRVFVKATGQDASEYLVNFDFLTKMVAEYGLKPVEITPFSGINVGSAVSAEMSPVEKEFSYLHTAFRYKKTGPASDKAVKRLAKLSKD